MKFITADGDKINNKIKFDSKEHTVLFEGDGELLGICVVPGEKAKALTLPGKLILHCRDLVEIIEIDRKALVAACDKIVAEKAALGYKFLTAHYSNMVPINFKFKHRLSAEGSTEGLHFYFKER